MARNQNILVVDDDQDLVRSIATFLGARGYQVETANNGTEAQRKLDQRLPDLVVLDVMMDYDAEGLNLAYQLANEERTRKIPLVILSGFMKELDRKGNPFDFIQGREWPAAKMFDKPVKLADLAGSIENLLRERAQLDQVLAGAEA